MAALQRSLLKTSSFLRPITRFYTTDVPETDAPGPDVLADNDDYTLGARFGPLPFIIEKSLNKVTLMGRAGNKPVRQGTDKKATVFNLATNSIEMDENGEMKKRTDWHRIAVFKPHLQESVYNYLQKGQRCLVQGQLTYGEVKDFAGVSHPSTTIFAEQVVLLLPRKKKEDDM